MRIGDPLVFDAACYLERYPDVAADGKYNTAGGAYQHWISFGQFEGRIPGCDAIPIDTGGDTSAPTTTDKNNTMLILGGIAIILFFFRKKLFK